MAELKKKKTTKKFRIKEIEYADGTIAYIPQYHWGRVHSPSGKIYSEYAKNEEEDNWNNIHSFQMPDGKFYSVDKCATEAIAKKIISKYKKALLPSQVVKERIIQYLN